MQNDPRGRTFFPVLVAACAAWMFLAVLPAGAPLMAQQRGGGGRMADLQANRLLGNAKDLLEMHEYDRGVRMLESIIEQYPDSDVRYQAYLELGRHYHNLNDQAKAINYLRRLRELAPAEDEELDPDTREVYLESLFLTGTAFFEMGQYAAAFPPLRTITTRYAETSWANQAYYYIGLSHFSLGNWSRAIEALNMVGTFVDPDSPSADYVEAGRRYYVKIQDEDLPVLTRLGHEVKATITTSSGDEERITLVPMPGGEALYLGSIPTALGAPEPDDGTLQVVSGDTIEAIYGDANTREGGSEVKRVGETQVVSTASLQFTLGDFETTTDAAFLGSSVFVKLRDADIDQSPSRDSATVRVYSRYKAEAGEDEQEQDLGRAPLSAIFEEEEGERYEMRDEIEIDLAEIGDKTPLRSAEFGGSFRLAEYDEDEVDRLDEGVLAARLGDEVVVEYTDELHIQGESPRKVDVMAEVASEVSSRPSATQYAVQDPVVRARKNLVEGEAYLELARIFRSMGLREKAGIRADEGIERVDGVIHEESPLPRELTEEAFKIKWELYLAKGDLGAALNTTRVFNQLYPDSPFVDEALMGIAEIRLEEENYEEAIRVYSQVIKLPHSTARAEAQFRIAQAIEARGGEGDPERAVAAYKRTAERFPDSEFAGESLGKLVDHHIQRRSYAQANDLLEKIFQDYPDGGFLDAMLLKWVMVAFRMGDYPKAKEKAQQLIVEYPGSAFAERAKKVLPNIEARMN